MPTRIELNERRRQDFPQSIRIAGELPSSQMTKIGRNDPCPCGSEKKYKKCHGGPSMTPPPSALLEDALADMQEELLAVEG